jgi:hypothetical protein
LPEKKSTTPPSIPDLGFFDGSTDLIRRIVTGDPAAEQELVNLFSPGLEALAARRGIGAPETAIKMVLMAVVEEIRAGSVQNERVLAGYVRAAIRKSLSVRDDQGSD